MRNVDSTFEPYGGRKKENLSTTSDSNQNPQSRIPGEGGRRYESSQGDGKMQHMEESACAYVCLCVLFARVEERAQVGCEASLFQPSFLPSLHPSFPPPVFFGNARRDRNNSFQQQQYWAGGRHEGGGEEFFTDPFSPRASAAIFESAPVAFSRSSSLDPW